MPVFWFLVVLGLCLLWLVLSFCFKPFGKLANRLWGDAQKAMSEDDKDDNEKEKENHEI